MPDFIKKTVAIVTVLSVSLWIAGPVYGQTIEELEKEIAELTAKLEALQKQLAELQAAEEEAPAEEEKAPAVTVEGIPEGFVFEKHLYFGMTDVEVKYLQIALNHLGFKLAEEGPGSPGNETEYFGPLTKAAVIKFQEKYAEDVLAPWGLTAGTGYVGKTTIAKLNDLLAPPEEEAPPEEKVPPEEEVSPEEEKVIPAKTEPTVELAPDTPAAAPVPKGAVNVEFARVLFHGGEEGYTVTAIHVLRGGVSKNTDLETVRLYSEGKQLGIDADISEETNKASFTELNWYIPPKEVKTLVIKADVASGAGTGNSIKLGIASAADIEATLEVTGEFPIMGNAKTVASIAVGSLTFTDVGVDEDVLSGGKEVELGTYDIDASGEAFDLHSLTFTQLGTAPDGDITNFVLKVGEEVVGTAEKLVDSRVTFDLSANPVRILTTETTHLHLVADISVGAVKDRTIKFEISGSEDVIAFGTQSGGAAKAAGLPVNGGVKTIIVGEVSVSIDTASDPTAPQEYVLGTKDNLFTALKITASDANREALKVVKIRVKVTSANNAKLGAPSLWKYDPETGKSTLLTRSYSVLGSYRIFKDPAGLFEVDAGKSYYLHLKAGIAKDSAYGANVTLKLTIEDPAHFETEGVTSGRSITAASVSMVGADAHSVKEKGSLTVTATGKPAARGYVRGTTDFNFADFEFKAEDEGIKVSKVIAKFGGTNFDSKSVKNIRLMEGTEVVKTVSALEADNTASFAVDVLIEKDKSKTLSIWADVPTDSTATDVYVKIEANKVTAKGQSSGKTITAPAVDQQGATMTVSVPSIKVRMLEVPADQKAVENAKKVTVGTIRLVAGDAEDVKITDLKIVFSSTTAFDAAVTDQDFDYIYLFEKGKTEPITNGKLGKADIATGTPASVKFSALSFIVPKGSQKDLEIKVDVTDGAATGNNVYYFGFNGTTTAEINGVGVISKDNLDNDKIDFIPANAATIYSKKTELKEKGEATVALYHTPKEALLAVGRDGVLTKGVVFHKTKWTASFEPVQIQKIVLSRTNGRDDNFAAFSLYVNGEAISANVANTEVGEWTITASDTVLFEIPKDGEAILEVKADLNSVGAGTLAGDKPSLSIDATKVTAKGASSGKTISLTGTHAGNAQRLYQSIPTVNLGSAVATDKPTAGPETEVMKLKVAAHSLGDVVLKQIALKPVTGGDTDVTGDNGIKVIAPDGIVTQILHLDETNATTTGDPKVIQVADVTKFQVGEKVLVKDDADPATTSDTYITSIDSAAGTITIAAAGTLLANRAVDVLANGYKSGYVYVVDITDYSIQKGTTAEFVIKADTNGLSGKSYTMYAPGETDGLWVWSDGNVASVNGQLVLNLPITGPTLSIQ